jgi:hypothetical protein
MNQPQETLSFVGQLMTHNEELFRERTEDDEDIRVLVTNAFAAAGHPNPESWLNQDVDESSYASTLLIAAPIAQRDLINRLFRLMLSKYPHETMEARYCLTNMGDLPDWMDGIRKIVIPDLMRLRLV